MPARQDLTDARLANAKMLGIFKWGGVLQPSVAATGNSLGTAREVKSGFTPVTAGNGTRGVILATPTAPDGDTYILANMVTTGTNTVAVYPPTGHSIDGATAGAAYTLAVGRTAAIVNTGPTTWRSFRF